MVDKLKKMFKVVFLILLLQFCVIWASPEVEIQQGKLKGQFKTSVKDTQFMSFTGIPYAVPPIGNLRFEAPVAAKPWKGILDATKPIPICSQIDLYFADPSIKGTEDCLYLNVYTPQLLDPTKELLPVMFYIHGGAFTFGSGGSDQCGPEILIDKEIVLVTINYRLGPLGFLSTQDEVVPGNNGLKDQSLGLRWVKSNIRNFGGDPDKITIFGESAGSASVHYQLLTPLNKNLISGAILESGTALGFWSLSTDDMNLENTKKLASLLDCPTNNTRDLVDCLKRQDAKMITAQLAKLVVWDNDPPITFRPVIESDSEGAFITKTPFEIIKNGEAAKVPILVGYNTDEGKVRSVKIANTPKLISELNSEFNQIAPITMGFNGIKNKENLAEEVRKFYFDKNEIDKSREPEIAKMITDSWFAFAADALVRTHMKYDNQTIYYYVFGYVGSLSITKLFGESSDNFGACHTDELLYLFTNSLLPDYKPTKQDKKMRKLLSTLWTNFAKYGDPTPSTNKIIQTKWTPVQSDKLEYYFIMKNGTTAMSENNYPERFKFWRDLQDKLKWIPTDK